MKFVIHYKTMVSSMCKILNNTIAQDLPGHHLTNNQQGIDDAKKLAYTKLQTYPRFRQSPLSACHRPCWPQQLRQKQPHPIHLDDRANPEQPHPGSSLTTKRT